MALIDFFKWFNEITALPATVIFFGVAVLLTLKTRFVQLRSFRYFLQLLRKGFQESDTKEQDVKTINPFHALFTAMASTIGMGNLVVPAVAIYSGGPGALFWLLIYIFFGCVTKFAEVSYAVESRVKMDDGTVIGGPMQYLKYIASWLGGWYMFVIAFLYMSWSALQANTLALICFQEGISKIYIGIALSLLMIFVLRGGARRVGVIASKLVPIMFTLYVVFAMFILLRDISAVYQAFSLIFSSAFSSTAALGGYVGVALLQAMRSGIYRGIFITEAGIGTSSIAHAIADTKKPSDQGVLAMYSMMSDAFLSTISGLLVLVTGVWMQGNFRSTFIYEAFKMHAPAAGDIILLITISLFVLTTVIGNTFNGKQSFALLTHNKYISVYLSMSVVAIFVGALADVEFMWAYLDVLLTLIAIPNVLGLLYLAFKKPKVLEVN